MTISIHPMSRQHFSKPTRRTSIYFTPEVFAWVTELARKERRSVGSMVEALVDWHRHNMPVQPVDSDTISNNWTSPTNWCDKETPSAFGARGFFFWMPSPHATKEAWARIWFLSFVMSFIVPEDRQIRRASDIDPFQYPRLWKARSPAGLFLWLDPFHLVLYLVHPYRMNNPLSCLL